MTYIQYLHSLTTHPYALPTAIAPVLTIAPRPVLCAIRLPDKYIWRNGALVDIRLQFSHPIYEFVGMADDWYLLRNRHGVIGRKREDVLFADEAVAQVTFAILEAA